ncbi:preprotein translocase subunit SecG [Pullulanibacillus sp. KACC 23026]|uniref:preprotein translocase subunit SecG n=1 Tax=Pullulanibacillus sp. KACC 23026 TaxID=3028315 RepID=UPI0023B1EDFB|nr:preprotein translocase subunit SecG [Pullulanibacillus sp. KACC 23026]WEG13644.1 preprotein translocase subunit SecG [Pullulanibacillus sp. KACC 23026]
MHILLVVLLIISALTIVAIVLLQSGKSEGLTGAITGGAEQLFGKQKARGLDKVLHRITVVCGIVFFVVCFLLAFYF